MSNKLQVTILGCGSSLGVPVVGCSCNVCSSDSNYNKRTRSAIIINDDNTRVLVDFGVDIRSQLLRENTKDIDAAILTHNHADHVNGIDELRTFFFINNKPLKIYTDSATADIIAGQHGYLFNKGYLSLNKVDFFTDFTIGSLNFSIFEQPHGNTSSMGIRIGDFVYSNDVSDFTPQTRPYLQNIKTWILDCVSYNSNPRHAGLDKVLQWYEEYKPRQIFLTNMSHDIDYHEISKPLPPDIKPLYDGYRFSMNIEKPFTLKRV